MINYRKLGDYVLAEPFRPFRIRMASGQTFEIRHPETILVGRNTARVYTTAASNGHETWHDVSLLLMESLEPIGRPRRRRTDGN
ncbi:MAG TPA: hypothetical protein VJ783_17085 [Pirellulales bacterium]|nr:hypothetical protein [Pirellulales bacterium]